MKDLYIISKDFLFKRYLKDRRQFMRVLQLDWICLIWLSHLQLPCRMIPRCLWYSHGLSSEFENFKILSRFLFGWHTFKRSVFSGANDTFHSVAHLCILLRSEFKISPRVILSLRLRYVLVSSAKSFMVEVISLVISFIYTRKSMGPRTDPCGTPAFICK